MRKIVFISLMIVLAAACSRTVEPQGVGRLNLSLNPRTEVGVVTKSTIEDFGIEVEKDSFLIRILNTSKVPVWEGTFSEWNDTTGIAGGNYFIYASYGDPTYAKPYFEDVQFTEIKAWDITPVILAPYLKNSIIRISCSPYVKAYYPERSFVISTACVDSLSVLEGKECFLEPSKAELNCSFVNQNGTEKELFFELGKLEENTFYDLTVESSNLAGTVLQISFNDTVQTVEIEEELNKK